VKLTKADIAAMPEKARDGVSEAGRIPPAVISIVCWLWNGTGLGDRPYAPQHVNTLRKAIARHTSIPHRFVCVADSAAGFDKEVEVFITPLEAKKIGELRSPEGGRFPSCYRRLWNFSPEAKALGDVLFCVDIDTVAVRDWAPLLDRKEDFVGWRPYRDWGRKLRFGGGSYLIKAGSRPQVWADFRGQSSINEARRAGFRGSDQAWLSYKLGGKEPYYAKEDGIYSIRDMKGTEHRLPRDARMVHFNGPTKPWSSPLLWVKEHWQ
jgi:hypothetical protein